MKKILSILLLLLIFIVCFPYWLPKVGKFLVLKDHLLPADVIVALRGDDYFRIQKAVNLYEKKYAEKIFVSPIEEHEKVLGSYHQFRNKILRGDNVTSEEFVKRAFNYFSQKPIDLYIWDRETTSTFEEAMAAKTWMQLHQLHSMILVTSGYHMRRVRMIYRSVFKGTGIEIYWVTATNPLFAPDQWWRKERDVKAVLNEYVAIPFNWFYHFVLKKSVTSFDTV